ncbi:MAG: DUF1902 domain-containing protein [Magnetococcus sp. YQC-5]
MHANWDEETGRWWADSEDVPGLVTEAATLEELITHIRDLTPELLRLNDALPAIPDFPIHVIAERLAMIHLHDLSA